MRFLVRLSATGVPKDRLLSTARSLAKSVGVEARNPKWSSAGSLELDVFCRSRSDFDLFISVTAPVAKLEFVTDLNVAPTHMDDGSALTKASALFNAERYWECHEVLEGVWRTKQGQEKTLLQGMILVCAAFVHHQKGNDLVALGVLARASKQLSYSSSEYHGLDLPAIRAHALSIIKTGKFRNFRV